MSLSSSGEVDVSFEDRSADASAPVDVVLRATGTRWRFGGVQVSDLQLDVSDDDARTRGPLVYPPHRSINVAFVLKGAVHVVLNESTFIFVAGSGLVLPTNELPPFSCTEVSRVLVVSLAGPDVSELRGLVPGHPTAIAAAVVETHPALGFLLAVVDTARHHPVTTPPAGAIIAKLVASLLTADLDWRTRPANPRVSEVLALIDERHTDPGFDAKAVARQLRVTPRDIEHLLREEHGGRQTGDLLLERRLVAAMTLLHPENSLSAEQIAARSGFPSVSHLDSAIEEVYGLNTKTLLAIRQVPDSRQAETR